MRDDAGMVSNSLSQVTSSVRYLVSNVSGRKIVARNSEISHLKGIASEYQCVPLVPALPRVAWLRKPSQLVARLDAI